MDAKALEYEDVKGMIFKLSWKFARNENEWEECVSVGNEAFLRAWDCFDPQRGVKFSTYLYRCVFRRLQTHFAEAARRMSMEKTNSLDGLHDDGWSGLDDVEDRSVGRIESILEDIGDDARLIVQTILELPADLKCLISARKPKESRFRLQKYLRKRGFKVAQLVECFEEIEEALC